MNALDELAGRILNKAWNKQQLDRIETALALLLVRTDPGPLKCAGLTNSHWHGETPMDYPLAKGDQRYGPLCLDMDGKRLDGGSK